MSGTNTGIVLVRARNLHAGETHLWILLLKARGCMSLIISDKRKHKQLKAKTCCLSKLGYIVFESNQQPPCVCVCHDSWQQDRHKPQGDCWGGGGYNLFHYFNELCMSCSWYNGLIVPIEVALHLEFK